MKRCSKCNEVKTKTEFYIRKEMRDNLRSECKECYREYKKEYQLMKRYGITLERYNEMWEEQFGRCAICGIQMKGCKAHIDHCHASDEIRGILCQHCNRGLGGFFDNNQIIYNAIEYLNQRGKIGQY